MPFNLQSGLAHPNLGLHKDKVSKSTWNVQSGEQLKHDEGACEQWLSIESQQVNHVGEDDGEEEDEARKKSSVVVINARMGGKLSGWSEIFEED